MKSETGVTPQNLRIYTSPIITISQGSNIISLSLKEDFVSIVNDFIQSNYPSYRKVRITFTDEDIAEYDKIESDILVKKKQKVTVDVVGQSVMVSCGLLQNIKGKILEKLPDGKYMVSVEINNIKINIKLNESNIIFLK